jgi:hypothetical protein
VDQGGDIRVFLAVPVIVMPDKIIDPDKIIAAVRRGRQMSASARLQ